MTPKLPIIILTDDLHEQMTRFINDQDAPPAIAVVVREALTEYLRNRGYPTTDIHPQRGGRRD